MSSHVSNNSMLDVLKGKAEKYPKIILQHMECHKLISAYDFGKDFNSNFHMDRVRNSLMLVMDFCHAMQSRGSSAVFSDHVLTLLKMWIFHGTDFINKGAAVYGLKDPNDGSDGRKDLIRRLKIKVEADDLCSNLTVKRLSYAFPEVIGMTMDEFIIDNPKHKLREGMRFLPGLFCWYGAAASIPNEYWNWQVLHQIWCLKHEYRTAVNANDMPKTADVMRLWVYTFNSKVHNEKERKENLKKYLTHTRGIGDLSTDASWEVLASEFSLLERKRMIPFTKDETVQDTLKKLAIVTKSDEKFPQNMLTNINSNSSSSNGHISEPTEAKESDFVRFYSVMYNFVKENKLIDE